MARRRRLLRFVGGSLGLVFVLACGSEGDGKKDPGPHVDTGVFADPGPSRYVEAGVRVTLDGTRSRSSFGDIVSWAWEQTGGPDVILDGAGSARPSFDAPAEVDDAGVRFTFELVVTDVTGATASGSLDVLVTPPTGVEETTSAGKIRKGMAEGTLDRETAVRYLAYALRGDPRLPAEWTGTEDEPSGTAAMHVIVQELATLPAAVREELAPFLLPASAPGSWYEQRAPTLRQGLGAEASASPVWLAVDGEHVSVIFEAGHGLDAKAEQLRDEIESRIWDRLEELFGPDHMPLSDAGVAGYNPGGDGRLDVVLVRGLPGAYGVETPHAVAPSPAYVEIEAGLPLHGKDPPGLAQVAAHEITHACQDSYRQREPYGTTKWIFEGTATWAEDHVYRDTNSEHASARELLPSMHLPLDHPAGLRSYGTYLFFQYMTRAVDDAEYVRRVFEQFQDRPALEAIDAALSDGSKVADHWGDFLEAAWNRGPEGWFRDRDGLEDEAFGQGGREPEAILGGMGPDLAMEVDAKVRHLSGRYRHFVLDDARHRWIRFYDGLHHRLWIEPDGEGGESFWLERLDDEELDGIDVRILVKRNGVWDRLAWFDGRWEHDGTKGACRDALAERFEELVVIFGNGRTDRRSVIEPADRDPVLWTTNLGCFEWQGTASAVEGTGPRVEVSSTSRWRVGRVTPTEMILAESSGSWTISGEVGSSPPEVCTAEGSGTWSETYDPDDWRTDRISVDLDSLSGPEHRSFIGVESGPDMPYTVTCRVGDEVTETYTASTRLWPFTHELWCGDELQPVPMAGADGTVSGTHDCQEWESREWSFRPVAE